MDYAIALQCCTTVTDGNRTEVSNNVPPLQLEDEISNGEWSISELKGVLWTNEKPVHLLQDSISKFF